MALDQAALLELVETLTGADDGELMREVLTAMVQALIDAEATAHIGAGPHDRTEFRTNQRNGTRDKTVTTGEPPDCGRPSAKKDRAPRRGGGRLDVRRGREGGLGRTVPLTEGATS